MNSWTVALGRRGEGEVWCNSIRNAYGNVQQLIKNGVNYIVEVRKEQIVQKIRKLFQNGDKVRVDVATLLEVFSKI